MGRSIQHLLCLKCFTCSLISPSFPSEQIFFAILQVKKWGSLSLHDLLKITLLMNSSGLMTAFLTQNLILFSMMLHWLFKTQKLEPKKLFFKFSQYNHWSNTEVLSTIFLTGSLCSNFQAWIRRPLIQKFNLHNLQIIGTFLCVWINNSFFWLTSTHWL